MTQAARQTERVWGRSLIGLLALLLSACASNRTATPPSAFPPPVMAQLQMGVMLDIDDAFGSYTHTETLPDRGGSWTLPIGPASVDWLQGLMQARFASIAGGSPGMLRFKPRIDRMEISLPNQTGTSFYEAWIQYRVAVINGAGQTVAEWPIAAYGKSRDSTMLSADVGLGRAMNQAMRDATAALALELQDGARIAAWAAGGGR